MEDFPFSLGASLTGISLSLGDCYNKGQTLVFFSLGRPPSYLVLQFPSRKKKRRPYVHTRFKNKSLTGKKALSACCPFFPFTMNCVFSLEMKGKKTSERKPCAILSKPAILNELVFLKRRTVETIDVLAQSSVPSIFYAARQSSLLSPTDLFFLKNNSRPTHPHAHTKKRRAVVLMKQNFFFLSLD